MIHRDTILWDLDGTLLNTLTDLTDSVNAALTNCGLPPRSRQEVRGFVGNGIRLLMERAVPDGAANPLFERTFHTFKAHYAKNCNNHTRPFAGIPEVLETLSREGYRMGVVSNKIEPAVQELVQLYFASSIEVAVGDAPGYEKKPAPDNPKRALELLNSDRNRALYIGDSRVDIQTAQNCGLPMIIVDWGYQSKEELVALGGKNIVSAPSQLLAAIHRLSAAE